MSYLHSQWRLVITPPSRGAWNMAVDEAILEAVGSSQSVPCLRLYAWDPACLSIGYAQPSYDIDFARLSAHSWDWVRRPTGGRAILHTDELTYSVIAPSNEPRVAGSVIQSYQRLSAALLAALYLLDIPAEAHPLGSAGKSAQNDPVCFEVPSNYEIVSGGKKLIGSAQARRKEGVLQHGTLPLFGDLLRITQVLKFPDEQHRREAGERLFAHATTVERALGRCVDWQTVAQAFVDGFQSALNLELVLAELTISENKRASQLVEEKYNHPAWLRRI